MHTLVDGYNVLYAMPEFHSKSIQRDLETGRKLLAGKLMRYSRVTGGRITLVFDGRGRDLSEEAIGGTMRLAFTPDADEFITETVRTSGAAGTVRVVTSDRELREEVKRLGGSCQGPRSFLGEVKRAIRGSDEDTAEKPSDLGEEEVDGWLKEFGFREDEGKNDDG